MNKNAKYLFALALPAVLGLTLMTGCGTSDPNSPGSEYMGDMNRGPALETNLAISQWNDSIGANMLPPSHTVRRAWVTAVDKQILDSKGYPVSMWFPYGFENSTTGDSLAAATLMCPLPMTTTVEAKGEALYNQFCIACHGSSGKGDGEIVKNGKFPATPPDYTKKTEMKEGHIYHVIMHGKGVMGSHASQLEPAERWQVVRYVQKLMRGGTSGEEVMAAMKNDTASKDSINKPAAPANAAAAHGTGTH